jgi:flagellar basal body-associated protein FliL
MGRSVMNWKSRLILIIVAIVVITSGYSYYYFLGSQRLEGELVIYTYESLLKWGDDPDAVRKAVFEGFNDKYGVSVKVVSSRMHVMHYWRSWRSSINTEGPRLIL